jgi:nicotinate phosphoribosyltransferase
MIEVDSPLKTDLYELTMAAAFFQKKVDARVTFELFLYKKPKERSYFIASGLEQVVDFILNLKFSAEDVDFLRNHSSFKYVKPAFFDYLRKFKFSGNLYAMPEGEIFFSKEPIIQVEAPIIEAQILETYLLSTIQVQSLVSTKASRVVLAARSEGEERSVIDFGSRRAHGPEAGIFAARAAYIGGCIGTSNVYAGKLFNIPTYGTMAHSWVQAFDKELDSFNNYYDVFPEDTVLLIDTYDTIKAAKEVASLKKDIKGVRLDSGNLEVLSKKVRTILDNAGLQNIKIIASGNLNEYKILELLKRKSPIDIFGVGTEMVTSKDLPSLDLIYKLVQIEDKDGNVKFKSKLSKGKRTIPGRKQVFRKYTGEGLFSKDIIGLFSEKAPKNTTPLLEPVIKNGALVKELPEISTIRRYAGERLHSLPAHCLNIPNGRYLKVEFSEGIMRLK